MILALVIFLITYALMLSLQKYRPWIALCSAAVFLILGLCGVYALTPAAAFLIAAACAFQIRMFVSSDPDSTNRASAEKFTQKMRCMRLVWYLRLTRRRHTHTSRLRKLCTGQIRSVRS